MFIPSSERRYLIVLIVLALLWATILSSLATFRHQALYSNLWDLGWMEQWTWNAFQGRFFRTSVRGDPQGNFLAEHITLIPALLVPLYALLPRAETLLVLQSVVLAAGVVPLYLLARHVLDNQIAAFLLGLGYLISPLTINIALFDFHPIAFVIPVLLALFMKVVRGDEKTTLLLGCFALLIQEEVALTLFMVGLITCCWRKRRLGTSLIVLATVWFGGVWVSNLTFLPHGSIPRLFSYRYTLSLTPHLKLVFLKWRYLLGTLGIYGFLPLLGGISFLSAVPALFYNLASIFVPQLDWCCQYTAILIAPLFTASIFAIRRTAYGLGRMRKIDPGKAEIFLAGWLLGALLFSSLALSGSNVLNLVQVASTVTDQVRLRYQALQLIPPDAPVASGNSLGAHLARREELYDFPRFPFKAEWVIFDTKRRVDQGFEGIEFYESQVDKLNGRLDYGLIADFDGVLVYKKADGS